MKVLIRQLIFITIILSLGHIGISYAQEDKKPAGPPPAKVETGEVRSGLLAPESIFVGTVYFTEVSDLSAEVGGKAVGIFFEEGQRVGKGKVLVQLSTDIIEKSLESTRASHSQVLADLEMARLDLKRIEPLFKQDAVSEQVYDENRFRVKTLESREAALQAEVAKQELELGKMKIRAPFNGVILNKSVDTGEWISAGGKVATVARDDEVDIIVNVPQDIIDYVDKGVEVKAVIGSKQIKGKVNAIVPRGDIVTRTFPVRIRIKNTIGLKEGMEAKVNLPSGAREDVLMVNRDAVITQYGRTLVFVVDEGKAKPVPVIVVGYDGLTAGIKGQGLEPGMKVVTKGNERLREGQELISGN